MIWLVAYLSSVLGAFLTIIAMTVMREDERHNLGKVGWLALTLLSPPVGLLLFLWLGGKRTSTEHQRREAVELPSVEPKFCDEGTHGDRLLLDFFEHYGIDGPTCGNRVSLLSDVDEVLESFLQLIGQARETIYLMTFILDDGPAASKVIDALCERAAAGIDVRLLCDGFGSFFLPEHQLQQLRDAGGVAKRFKPFSHLSRLAYFSFRNHRKVLIVDSRSAILGGANIAQTEMSRHPSEDSWIDLSLRVDGPAAYQMQAVFQSDWGFVTGESLPISKFRGHSLDEGEGSRLTILPIGPNGADCLLDDFWQYAIHHAKHRIWICTPYFVPPPLASKSLQIACRRGVDVRILVPDDSDLPPVDNARLDYFNDLDALGATILRYPNRMVHAKIGIVDDLVALVGSANFDVRSFFLNYELSVAVHDDETIRKVSDWFSDLADECETGPGVITLWKAVQGTVARIFASEL